ncbi:POZ domain-containing protein [Testicularia cyperi]|uniref:Elongin-C n=1 Tax=Testicularia cyperi TaxID=1882483 RepID=A0A317XUI0_9BASI|nr:POZ domain-containing protein [Testicularia cyperi]
MATGKGSENAEKVTLISEDGYRFIVDSKVAQESPTIKTMLSMGEGGGFAEAESNTARLQIRGEVLEKVIEFLYFKAKYGTASEAEIPDFKQRIPPEISLEL